MAYEVDVLQLINPRCLLLYDGTNWYVLRGDSDGNLNVGLRWPADGPTITAGVAGTNPVSLVAYNGVDWRKIWGTTDGALLVMSEVDTLWQGHVTPSSPLFPVSPMVNAGSDLYQQFGDADGHQYVQQRPGDGWEDAVDEVLSYTLPGAGAATLSSTAVPANEVHVIETFCWRVVGAAFSTANVQIISTAGGIVTSSQATPATSVWYFWNGAVHLKEGQYLKLSTWGGVLNDIIQLRLHGYKMYVDNP